MPAPAIPDMATQVRCPNCHHLFADGDVRYQDAASFRWLRPAVRLGCAFLVAWTIYQLI
jgi:hypothetical protein